MTIHQRAAVRLAAAILAAVLSIGTHARATVAQNPAVAELAARMTGRWLLNKELSSVADPGRGRGGRRGGGASLALGAAGIQRGGRAGGGGGIAPEPVPERPGVTPAEAAAQAALSIIERVSPEMTIDATPTTIKFVEPRGESVFQIDGKNTSVAVPGGTIKVKSRWDRTNLRQDFSSTQRVLHRSWSFDSLGRLVLTQRIESASFRSGETQAVFDRQ